MSWQNELDDLDHRKTLARKMGGTDKIQRQHDNGKLTVRGTAVLVHLDAVAKKPSRIPDSLREQLLAVDQS